MWPREYKPKLESNLKVKIASHVVEKVCCDADTKATNSNGLKTRGMIITPSFYDIFVIPVRILSMGSHCNPGTQSQSWHVRYCSVSPPVLKDVVQSSDFWNILSCLASVFCTTNHLAHGILNNFIFWGVISCHIMFPMDKSVIKKNGNGW